MSLRIPPIIHGIETALLVYLDLLYEGHITYELVDALPVNLWHLKGHSLRESGAGAPSYVRRKFLPAVMRDDDMRVASYGKRSLRGPSVRVRVRVRA